MAGPRADAAEKPHSPLMLALLGVIALAVFIGLIGLGNWQMARRAWKLDLIERVETRVHAPPVAAPGPAEWPMVAATTHEYRHVRLSGRFLPDADTPAQATIERGGGSWIMTPLRTDTGYIVFVNRGFTGGERGFETGPAKPAPDGPVQFDGLLRVNEPGGSFLRVNDPARGLWFSRDIPAMAAARGLDAANVAPYFVDAEPAPGLPSPPVAGLTTITFPNNHLVYAITWYFLALMLAGGIVFVGRYEWRLRRRLGGG